MTDINTVDTNIPGAGHESLKPRTTVKDVQHWDYEWEKAFIEHENTRKERSAAKNNENAGPSQESDTNAGQILVPDVNATRQAVVNIGVQVKAADHHDVPNPGARSVIETGSASSEKSVTKPVLPQQGILVPSPGIIPATSSSTNGNQNVNAVEQLQSSDWQVVARVVTKVQPTKAGLIVYKSEDSQVKVWLRDKSVLKHQGVRLISELRGLFSGLGVTLAAFTLNGEQLYEHNTNSTINITDEVTTWPSKV